MISSRINILNLNNLTTARIDSAIKTLKANHIPFKEDLTIYLYQTMDMPWTRLEKLINQDNESGLYLLAILVGENIHTLKNTRYFLKAVNIFLRYMRHGPLYLSTIRLENNYFNDALYCGDLWKDLTTLLILNGADPERTNGDKLTALAFTANFFNPNIEKEELIFCGIPFEDLLNVLVNAFCYKDFDVMPVLEAANLYGLIDKYPALFNCKISRSKNQGNLLHLSISWQPEFVIEYLIEKGANPDLLDIDRRKPLHHAVKKLMKLKEISENSHHE